MKEESQGTERAGQLNELQAAPFSTVAGAKSPHPAPSWESGEKAPLPRTSFAPNAAERGKALPTEAPILKMRTNVGGTANVLPSYMRGVIPNVVPQASLGPFLPSSYSLYEPTHQGKMHMRRGKWTIEEERYAQKIIECFDAGIINIKEGTTLRSCLSLYLSCDGMRISKKFSGKSCLGKRVFTPSAKDDLTPEKRAALQMELNDARTILHNKMQCESLQENLKVRKLNEQSMTLNESSQYLHLQHRGLLSLQQKVRGDGGIIGGPHLQKQPQFSVPLQQAQLGMTEVGQRGIQSQLALRQHFLQQRADMSPQMIQLQMALRHQQPQPDVFRHQLPLNQQLQLQQRFHQAQHNRAVHMQAAMQQARSQESVGPAVEIPNVGLHRALHMQAAMQQAQSQKCGLQRPVHLQAAMQQAQLQEFVGPSIEIPNVGLPTNLTRSSSTLSSNIDSENIPGSSTTSVSAEESPVLGKRSLALDKVSGVTSSEIKAEANSVGDAVMLLLMGKRGKFHQ